MKNSIPGKKCIVLTAAGSVSRISPTRCNYIVNGAKLDKKPSFVA